MFLDRDRGKHDWALVDVHDIEAFLATLPKARKRRLTVLRQFFRFARDPEDHPRRSRPADLSASAARAGSPAGPSSWTSSASCSAAGPPAGRPPPRSPARHPRPAARRVQPGGPGLRVDDIDHDTRTVRLGTRPRPVPLDPASWDVLQRCLAHREASAPRTRTSWSPVDPAGMSPASAAYVSHVLDLRRPATGASQHPPGDLVNTIDPKLVAAAFGMDPEGVMFYLADRVDPGRLPATMG